jgi:hypothetical protein
MPEEKSPILERGNMIHTNAQMCVSASKPPKLIPELAKFARRIDGFRRARARTELEWTFTRDWTPTSWFAKDAWLRMKLDVLTEAAAPPVVTVVDYKSGKIYPDHSQQRSLYGLGALQLVQIGNLNKGIKATKVIAEHLYTDTGLTATETYASKDLEPLRAEWTARIKEMLDDTRFPTRIGFHCKWCRFRKSVGGPCPEDQ